MIESYVSSGGVEIRHNDGDIDEVVAENVHVHIEYMSDTCVWMRIGDVAFNFFTRRAVIRANADAEDDNVEIGWYGKERVKP